MKTKVCIKCGIEKPIEEFNKRKDSKDGYRNDCKQCVSNRNKKYRENNEEYFKKYRKQYYEDNKEYFLKNQRQYREENKSHIAEYMKQYYKENEENIKEYKKQWWKENIENNKENKRKYYKENKNIINEKNKIYYENNKEQYYIRKQNRRSKKKLLPNNLSNKQWDEVLKIFDYECALSNLIDNISLEHFIPLSIGHGGTTLENVYPLELSLNISKNGSNPFEWIKTQELYIQHNFYYKLIPYLSNINEMSNKEFKEYVYWCFDNKRTIEQIKLDNEKGLTSIDLWKQSNK